MKQKPIMVQAHPITGAIVTQNTTNPKFGKIMVNQTVDTVNGTFMQRQTRVAFIGGDYELLSSMFTKEGQTLAGNIVKQESDSPFYSNQEPVVYPANSERAGQTVMHRVTGAPYYVQFVINEDTTAPTTVWTGSKTTATVTEPVETTEGN